MIKKQKALVISFHTAMEAIAAEKYCEEHAIAARIIPLPGELSAGCGLALKAPADLEDTLPHDMTGAGLKWDTATVLTI